MATLSSTARNTIANIAVIVALVLLGFGLGRCSGAGNSAHVTTDTTIYVDTIKYDKVVPRDTLIVSYKVVSLPLARQDTQLVRDTVYVAQTAATDSVQVVVPISQLCYSDSTYTAWVSGYNAALDSIYVYAKREVITLKERVPPSRWGIGISAGIAVTPTKNAIQPFLGVGVTYRLLDF